MAGEGAVASGQSDARRLVEAKVRAELGAADALCPGADAIAYAGSLSPVVVLVKGMPGDADRLAGVALAGADGEAASKALEALGIAGPSCAVCSRSEPGIASESAAVRIRTIIEALDPSIVIALDGIAAEDVATGFGISPLVFGMPAALPGRTLLAVDDLEGSLAGDRKSEVWEQFKGLRRTGDATDSSRGARRRPDEQVLF